ncbi:MAG: HD domain-containing phosphohydrolase [Nitrospinota bacterium]
MKREIDVSLSDMVISLSKAVDGIDPALNFHHARVAYLAHSIAAELNMGREEQNNVLLSGLLHDIGAISLKERLNLFHFESENSSRHANTGYRLLKGFNLFSKMAAIVRYHHARWDNTSGSAKGVVPLESYILHLADRTIILIEGGKEILGQVKGICSQIEKESNKMFMPMIIEVFKRLSAMEYLWLDIVSPSIEKIILAQSSKDLLKLNIKELIGIAKVFSRIIDFRSNFTATHTSGISATAVTLARIIGLSEIECEMMKIAGYLHDLGKLAVPAEILEKPGKLTDGELNIVRSHTYHTFRILEPLKDLYEINSWASFHHECLDGSGYPFHYKADELSLGARIVAVADIFTAITEDRPYRRGMAKDAVLEVLKKMVENNKLDSKVVSTLIDNYEMIDSIRKTAQEEASKEYHEFRVTL